MNKIPSLLKEIETLTQQQATKYLQNKYVLEEPVAVRYLIGVKGGDPSADNWKSLNNLLWTSDLSFQTKLEVVEALILLPKELDMELRPLEIIFLHPIIFNINPTLFIIIYENSTKIFTELQIEYLKNQLKYIDIDILRYLIADKPEQFEQFRDRISVDDIHIVPKQEEQEQEQEQEQDLFIYIMLNKPTKVYELLNRRVYTQEELLEIVNLIIYNPNVKVRYIKTILNLLNKLPPIEFYKIKSHDVELIKMLVEKGYEFTDKNLIIRNIGDYDDEEQQFLSQFINSNELSLAERNLRNEQFCENKGQRIDVKNLFVFEEKDSNYCFTKQEYEQLPKQTIRYGHRSYNTFLLFNNFYVIPKQIKFGHIYKTYRIGINRDNQVINELFL